MTEFQILLTIMLTGFGLNGSLMLIMWNYMNNRFDKIDQRFEAMNKKFTDKIEALDKKFTDKIDKLDSRLGNLETRTTVIENKIIDINQNIHRLMWQNQAIHNEPQEK